MDGKSRASSCLNSPNQPRILGDLTGVSREGGGGDVLRERRRTGEKKRDETGAQLLLRTVDADFKCNLLRVCVASPGRRDAGRARDRAMLLEGSCDMTYTRFADRSCRRRDSWVDR